MPAQITRNRRKYDVLRKTIDGLEPLIVALKSCGEEDIAQELQEIKDQLMRMLLHSTRESGTIPVTNR